jgi:large subunit ribosomal protein L15
MKIHELEISSLKDDRRLGRGIGSGRGKTAGRGTKGQNSRTGSGVRSGFEGGQNPLAKRLPKKRGFTAINPVTYQTINLGKLDRFAEGSIVDNATLAEAGLIRKAGERVKLLAVGDLTKKLIIKVQAASATAKKAVEKSGSTLELSDLPKTPSKKPTRPESDTK